MLGIWTQRIIIVVIQLQWDNPRSREAVIRVLQEQGTEHPSICVNLMMASLKVTPSALGRFLC